MVRLNLDYQSLIDKDVTTVDTQILQKLDAVISAAIDNNLHLNICFTALPGRRVEKDMENYTYSGEFDLFINPAKQAQADKLLSLFTRRYQQVPSAYLSFTPTWESTNRSLSSGLEAPEYTTDDVGRYLSHVIDLIHSMDSDRMIIAEPSENIFMGDIPTVYTPIYQYIKDKEYTITSYNFCEDSYVYAGMNATPGQHIDHNNQGVQIPSYPATVYFVRNALNKEKDLTIDGFLPAGTKLEVYLSNSDGNGDFLVLGDGQELYPQPVPPIHCATSGQGPLHMRC